MNAADDDENEGLSFAAAPQAARARRASQRLRGLIGEVKRLETLPSPISPEGRLLAVGLVRIAAVAAELVTRNKRVLREVRDYAPAETSALMALATAVDVFEMNVDLLAQTLVPVDALLAPKGEA